MQNVFAQKSIGDSLYLSTARANVTKRYVANRKSELLLYTGSDYADYEAIFDEHPFFLNDDWITGVIEYNGNVYEDIPLQYDIHSQKLILEHPSNGKKIELIQMKVKWFVLEKHLFVFLNDTQTHGDIPEGYYELLTDGNAKLFASHSKAFQESTATGKLEVRVEESKKYFIHKGNAFVQVKGKKAVLDVLADKRDILVSGIKRKKINFSRDRHHAMIETVRTYNSLSQQ